MLLSKFPVLPFKLHNVAFLLLLLLANPLLAQFDYSKKLVGLMMKTGISYSDNDPIPSNQLIPGWGFYRYFNVNSKNESIVPFHYLKVEINGGIRSGLFKINNFF